VAALFTDRFDETVISLLKKGGVGVVRTDTLYGLIAAAKNEAAVERVFEINGRERNAKSKRLYHYKKTQKISFCVVS
jgi:tRNA A37 threonylcarbamoyladenosine synthetase subunit TsaC/SUA5/YrdC